MSPTQSCAKQWFALMIFPTVYPVLCLSIPLRSALRWKAWPVGPSVACRQSLMVYMDPRGRRSWPTKWPPGLLHGQGSVETSGIPCLQQISLYGSTTALPCRYPQPSVLESQHAKVDCYGKLLFLCAARNRLQHSEQQRLRYDHGLTPIGPLRSTYPHGRPTPPHQE
jgi:hypothetical protein